ncbi:hypothetical protein [Devosia sp. SD17-2]|uniref:hypothetical protein n=1 Tax=Devosia sp. SD17-2 TaxID=2976459 RepID=UPI0023D80DF4|nr:hypothetical protein [Devosia sp. SD17-2]WEJ34109.1 hypothetical protein NYQ88_04710 [Devosia sp. SD17-2]
MRHAIIAASLLLSTSGAALAQNLDALRDSLDHLPATVLMQEYGDLAYFVDVKVAAGLAGDDAEVRPFSRVLTGADMLALQSLASSEAAEWESKAGTTIDRVQYFAGYGRPPNVHSFWGLSDETAAADLIAALETVGFESAGAPGVIGNGEPQRMDPSKRDPSDPWRTNIGAAQFAAASGTNVVQAQTPQAAMIAASQQPRLGENPIMHTALSGLEQSVGDSQLVQAVVISPLFGMTGLDPSAFLSPSADMDETKKKIEEQMAALGSGIPPYLGGIVVDVQHESQGVGIALAYPDCEIAQQAADSIAARWVDLAGDAAQGEITAHTAEGEGGLCAATVSVYLNEDNAAQNPAYRAVVETYMRGQPGVLQIGQS